MIEQKILTSYSQLDTCLKNYKSIMLVCGRSIQYLEINKYFESLEKRLQVEVVKFSDFHPNPTYDSVEKGVNIYHSKSCTAIVAVGGGSAIDVAKCIKLYATIPSDKCYLQQDILPNNIPLIVVPTTAGTGSEATRYAVIYYNGEKQSINDYSIIPSIVLIDATVLRTLPLFQKKVTMLDAFCHAIESFWSINSTDESKIYSEKAIQYIMNNYQGYLSNTDEGNSNMLLASNLAGKAINITETTAGHAMCYKLTSLYKIPHGYACALTVSVLWPYMNVNIDKCIDARGSGYLTTILDKIGQAMGYKNAMEGANAFRHFIKMLDLPILVVKSENDYEELTTSVNPVRLKNHPIVLTKQVINNLYHQIFQLWR